jgi:hypothetical protein
MRIVPDNLTSRDPPPREECNFRLGTVIQIPRFLLESLRGFHSTIPSKSISRRISSSKYSFSWCELVFEVSDLTVCQLVLHPNRDLLCDLRQEFRFLSVERILFPCRYLKHARRAAPADEGHLAR